jgi:hypothetical protein
MAEEKKPLWYENKAKYNAEYVKNNVIQIMVKVNRNTEADLVEFLDTIENKQGYIKSLIRADMEAHKNK